MNPSMTFIGPRILQKWPNTLERLAETTRLELATFAMTVQQQVTNCNFTAPIATLGALRNP